MHNLKYIIFTLILSLLYSCDKYDLKGFISSPSEGVDTRFAESIEINGSDTTIIKIDGDSYSFLCAADIHYKGAADNFIRMMADATSSKPDFIIINGDLIDENENMSGFKEIENQCNIDSSKIFHTVGNHDLFFNQWNDFKSLFGASAYYFIVETSAAKDLFICLDSGNATLGKKQTTWLEDLLEKRRHLYRNCIVFTHTNLWLTDYSQFPSGNFTKRETIFIAGLMDKYNVDMIIQGHDHHRDFSELAGAKYITLDAIKDGADNASYMTVTCSSEITYEFIDL
jgi:predicted phosphodiesterase